MKYGGKVEDFMPWPKETEQTQVTATPEQVLAFLTSTVKRKK